MSIQSNRLESTTFSTTLYSPQEVKIREIMIHANRLLACRIDRRGNDSCQLNGVGFTNQFLVCRIANTKDESTLVGCIGQPSQGCKAIVKSIIELNFHHSFV